MLVLVMAFTGVMLAWVVFKYVKERQMPRAHGLERAKCTDTDVCNTVL
jgi:hypothetical protein